MKNFFIKGITAGFALLVINFIAIYSIIYIFPDIAFQYFDPIFSEESYKTTLYFIHPFLVSFALAWFWQRFKSQFHGSFWVRGLEVGLAYSIVAVFPSIWIVFSALSVTFTMALTWFLYGTIQGIVVGIIYAKIKP